MTRALLRDAGQRGLRDRPAAPRRGLALPTSPLGGRAGTVRPHPSRPAGSPRATVPRRALDEATDGVRAARAEVLGRADVGPADTLGDLGGDSLAATRVAARVRSRWGDDVPLRRPLKAKPVEDMVAAVRGTTQFFPASARRRDRLCRLGVEPSGILDERRYLLFQPADADTLTWAWRSGVDSVDSAELWLPADPFEPTLQSTNPISTLPALRAGLPRGSELRSVDPPGCTPSAR
ncbi:phosphopantetheine-binding protein [Actinomycetospora cinnamomea]|uniref:acyl carrier protein n=1 Tax=Actinomycetospora cinnamomea TaxID=663609 RepID=UPI000E3231F1